jgi:hypothetical protein
LIQYKEKEARNLFGSLAVVLLHQPIFFGFFLLVEHETFY